MKKVAFIRANTYNSDPRLIKISSSLVGHSKVFLLWQRELEEEKIDCGYYLHKNSPFGDTKRLLLNMPIWIHFCFSVLRKVRPDVIHACDIEAMIPAYFYSMFFRVKIVYDIWDATSGKVSSRSGFLAKIANTIDRFYIQKATYVFIPDYSRLLQLDQAMSSKIKVIPNSNYIPKKHEIINLSRKDNLVISYVGVMSQGIRGLEQIASISNKLPYCRFVIAGYGADTFKLERIFDESPLIKYVGKVTVLEAAEIYKKSDLIITLLDPDYVNYKYATSTKVFDAFANYKPVISTRGTASGELVEKSGWGVAVNYDEGSLLDAIEKIKSGNITFDLNYEVIKEYDWLLVAKLINQVYGEI